MEFGGIEGGSPITFFFSWLICSETSNQWLEEVEEVELSSGPVEGL